MTLAKKSTLWLVVAFTIAVGVFLKNAWVAEDAYILFRSIEQLFAGNGPIWNPHERVQVYTSPLWYWVVALSRLFYSDLYLNVIIVSLVLWVCTLVALRAIFKNDLVLLGAVLLLVASTAFFRLHVVRS